MGFRMLGTMAAALVATGLVAVGPTTTAEATDCWVRNARTRVVQSDLQLAVNDAADGDVLRVRGVCGPFSVDQQEVALVGPATIGFPDGPGWDSGHVAAIYGGKVTLRNVSLVGGSSTFDGGGVLNYGDLVLAGRTRVSNNVAEDGGGGIFNEGRLVLQDHARVVDNEILFGGGGGIHNTGTLIMRDHARVAGNDGFPVGGGVYNAGTMRMDDDAVVEDNQSGTGGGVYSTGSLWMGGRSRITGNTATGGTGGGLYAEGETSFSPSWSGTLCGNVPDDWPSCTS